MLDCIEHMTTIAKRRKPIFIGPQTNCYSRKKYRRSLFFQLEEILEVDPKIKATRSSFIFYKAYTTGVDDKVTIYPRFAVITIIRRLTFVDFPHVRTSPTFFSIKSVITKETLISRPAVHNFRKIVNFRLSDWTSDYLPKFTEVGGG